MPVPDKLCGMIFSAKEHLLVLSGKTFKTLQEQAFAIHSPLPLITLGIGVTIAIASFEPASAAGIVGDGTPGSCTEAALNTALSNGGNVYFNCGSNPHTIRVTSEKVISANTLIDGMTNGKSLITLSGGGQNRILYAKDDVNLTVKNLTIADGFTTDKGGGIYSGYRSKLKVNNCKLKNNKSTKSGVDDGGGAIYVLSDSTVNIENSEFTGNQASNGGAIYNLLSDLTVVKSTFKKNQSVFSVPGGNGGGGGAILIDGAKGKTGKIIIDDSTFTDNTAVAQGGAIFLQLYENSTSSFEDLTLSENSVTGNGNQGYGGAIFHVGSETTLLSVDKTTVSANRASNQGGGFWNGNNAKVNISNSTFSDNDAVSSDGKSGNGGGLMITSGKINITNTTIINNYAGFQGGGIVADSNTTITNVIIAYNVANNGGNNWNIKNNCFDQMTNGGNNLQFPGPNLNDPSDKYCAAGITVAQPNLGL